MATVKLIKAGRLIDGNGDPIASDASILIRDDRIEAVGPSAAVEAPPDAEVIDAGGYTVMPGMFDLHVHIAAFSPTSFHNYRVAIFEISPELQAYYTLYHAQLCLEMGFTTLRDLGRMTSRGQNTAAMVALRDAIDAGVLPGPRLLVCGRASITGGHLDLTLPRAAYRGHMPDLVADGPWELRKLTRDQLRHGVDVIKTCASGGGGTDKEEPDVRNMTQEELDAIADECRAFHKPCSVHCFTAESHRMCVRAKVDTIEHIVFTEDETIKMIKDSDIPVIPTLLHRTDRAIEMRREHGTPQFILKKMKNIQPYCFESFQKFHQAGIKLAMGTDIGVDPGMGENAHELAIYVDLGMTPMEAIMTATKNAAEAAWLDKDLGTLEAGKLADVVIIDGDPSEDITVLQDKDNVKMVIKEGHAYVDKIGSEPKYVVHPEPGSHKILDML